MSMAAFGAAQSLSRSSNNRHRSFLKRHPNLKAHHSPAKKRTFKLRRKVRHFPRLTLYDRHPMFTGAIARTLFAVLCALLLLLGLIIPWVVLMVLTGLAFLVPIVIAFRNIFSSLLKREQRLYRKPDPNEVQHWES